MYLYIVQLHKYTQITIYNIHTLMHIYIILNDVYGSMSTGRCLRHRKLMHILLRRLGMHFYTDFSLNLSVLGTYLFGYFSSHLLFYRGYAFRRPYVCECTTDVCLQSASIMCYVYVCKGECAAYVFLMLFQFFVATVWLCSCISLFSFGRVLAQMQPSMQYP